ncbi:MAG: acetyl-CoA C-acetyltransferase [Candidatus Sericytochromatia bacterium]|nr:acetyl-CoA C-acetyltransferase [Candidatus Sericytochromatia bacterium]
MELVILSGVRTPFGKFGGGLKDLTAVELGTLVTREALKRAGVAPEHVDHVIFGNVVQSDPGAIYLARHISIKSGIPIETAALTVNRLCGSGLQAVVNAAQQLLLGESTMVVAGGSENMSQIPYVLPNARWGYRMGNNPVVDMMTAALTDSCANISMAETAENLAEEYIVSREEQDVFALRSQQLAAAAIQSGRLAQEILPVALNDKKQTVVQHDEHPRETSLEKLAALKPAFKKNGTVTAANASGINDGAGALVVTTAAKAQELGVEPLARIKSWSTVGVPPEKMGIGPAPAIQQALERASLKLADLDLIEVNEAFAAQYLAVEKALGLDRDKVNVNGGAIALGHPLGASGARVLLTLMHELIHQQKRYGAASLCIGGGQGIAMIIENARL